MKNGQKTYAVVVAAGQGARMEGNLPKQFRLLNGVPLLRRTLLQVLKARESFEKILVVIGESQDGFYRQAVDGLPKDIFLPPVTGGATRQQSVHAALTALTPLKPDVVMLHDAARPFATAGLFEKILAALGEAKGAICACKIADTLKRVEDGAISQTIARNNLFAAQTPQAFDFPTLQAAHQAAHKEGRSDFTDDAALLEWQGHEVRIVESSAENFKITTTEDWTRAERLLNGGQMRSALGFDVHRFAVGNHVMLGGVKIPHSKGVDAHSDGDVILHALTDAVLGLIGAGDIGQHFPPSDPQWKNAPSTWFVEKALSLLKEHGGRLTHCDVTVIAETPKIGAHRGAITAHLAALTDLPLSSVGLKATTAEGLGMVGSSEGLCAYVLATAVFED